MKRMHAWGLLGVMVILQGCPAVQSLRNYTESGIGQPIETLKKSEALPNAYDDYAAQIGWQETTYPLENGNWVYVELDRKDCFIHWEVNPQGIIVDYRLEGRGCAGQ